MITDSGSRLSTYSCRKTNKKNQLRYQQIGTQDTTLRTKIHARLTGYSSIMTIVTWNRKITKVGTTPSN